MITPPLQADIIDLGDILILAAAPTADMLTLTVNGDGTVDFLLPREEVGQGITTAFAMLIADEMSLPLSSVRMHLQPGYPGADFQPADRRVEQSAVAVYAGADGRGGGEGAALAAAAGRLGGRSAR